MIFKILFGVLVLFSVQLKGQGTGSNFKKNFMDYCYGKTKLHEKKEAIYDFIGKVTLFEMKKDSNKLSINYFVLPDTLSKKNVNKYIESVGETYAKLWVNNSYYIKKSRKPIMNRYTYLVTISLALDNVIMQILSFQEQNKIYEIISFSDPASFSKNKILNDLKRGKCP